MNKNNISEKFFSCPTLINLHLLKGKEYGVCRKIPMKITLMFNSNSWVAQPKDLQARRLLTANNR